MDENLAETSRRAHLTRDGHHDQIGPGEVVGLTAGDHRGTLLHRGLVSEGERDQDHISELEGHLVPSKCVVDVVLRVIPNAGQHGAIVHIHYI
jgi:hypothetical protein